MKLQYLSFYVDKKGTPQYKRPTFDTPSAIMNKLTVGELEENLVPGSSPWSATPNREALGMTIFSFKMALVKCEHDKHVRGTLQRPI